MVSQLTSELPFRSSMSDDRFWEKGLEVDSIESDYHEPASKPTRCSKQKILRGRASCRVASLMLRGALFVMVRGSFCYPQSSTSTHFVVRWLANYRWRLCQMGFLLDILQIESVLTCE